MAATQNTSPPRRGNSRGPAFGYPIAPGETIYAGGLICVNAAGQAQRLQTAGSVAFVGIAQSGYNNSASANPGPNVVGAFDEFQYVVPGATPSNISAPVYATDDNTLTLAAPTTGFEKIVGYLIGIDSGKTYVGFASH